jgi:hypothetical protein
MEAKQLAILMDIALALTILVHTRREHPSLITETVATLRCAIIVLCRLQVLFVDLRHTNPVVAMLVSLKLVDRPRSLIMGLTVTSKVSCILTPTSSHGHLLTIPLDASVAAVRCDRLEGAEQARFAEEGALLAEDIASTVRNIERLKAQRFDREQKERSRQDGRSQR